MQQKMFILIILDGPQTQNSQVAYQISLEIGLNFKPCKTTLPINLFSFLF